MRPAISCLAALALLAGCDEFNGAQAHLYVSPRGNDSATGTAPSSPVRTLARARDLARARGTATTVAIADGVYELDETLAFTADDRDLAFEAAPGARPTLSAGRRITGWTVGADGFWHARVTPGERFSQLYVNGQRRVRPFLPRKGYYYAEKGHDPDPVTGQTRFVARKGHFPDGSNPGMEVCMFNVWTMSRSHVRAYDPATRVVSLALPNGKRDFDTIGPDRWYRYDNVRSALGEPGDWYLDADEGALTYVPMPGETPAACEIVAARHQHVATFSCATNIVWRGVTFAYADYGVQTNGNYFGQAAVGEPGAVQTERSKGIRFERCAVVHTGAYGISFTWSSEGCAVVGCELRDLGAGGVKIGDGRLRGKEFPFVSGCEVSDCLISEGGRVDPAGVGVWIGHAVSNRVAHNTIRDMYYSGISGGWNWSFAETARDNILEWNHIHDIGRHVLSDMGGIYLLGRQPGTVERYNHIHHVTRARNCAFGIYFDSGTSLVTATNNVVHDCEDTNFFLAAISASNRVENNIFVCGPRVQMHALPRNPSSKPTRYARNIIVWDDGKFTYTLQGENTIEMADNLYWCPEDIKPKEDPRGCAYAPIRFADLDARDLRLADTNAATKAGFIPFSIDGCGKTTPVSLTADLPKVPDVFFPAPEPIAENVDEDFENVAVGGAFPGWSVLQPDGTNTIRVTDTVAATGRHSLEIIDDKKDWRPHVYRTVVRRKGLCTLSFALMVKGRAQPRLILNGDDTGPVVRVLADGTLTASEKPLMKLADGTWYVIEIAMRLGKGRERHEYTVAVTPKDGERQTFTLPLGPKFRAFHWIGIHSCGDRGRYYIDDFRIVDRDPAAEQAGNQRGEGKR